MRAVDQQFRTIPTGAGRALAGLSEGGYGALNIGLHHPGEFRVLESWSGYAARRRLQSIFGGKPALLARNTPLTTLARAAPALRRAHTYVWLYSGSEDPLRVQNEAFANELAHLAGRPPLPARPRRPRLGGLARQCAAGAARRVAEARRMRSVLRVVAHRGRRSPAGIAIAAAATRLALRPRPIAGLPGPRIGEALPLDELAKRGASPLAALRRSSGRVAAAALGLLARARCGPTARPPPCSLQLGVGAWTYLTTGVSIAIVRQIPPNDAFQAAASLRAVYLPAALAGLAGALARPHAAA